MEDRSVAKDVAAILFDALREVVDVELDSLSDDAVILEAVRALHAGQLRAERGIRLLIALAYEDTAGPPRSRSFYAELAAAAGALERDLPHFYSRADFDALVGLVEGGRLPPRPNRKPGEPAPARVPAEPDGRRRPSSSSTTWWAMLGVLDGWLSEYARRPDPAARDQRERAIGQWLANEQTLLAAGRQPVARASALRGVLKHPNGGSESE